MSVSSSPTNAPKFPLFYPMPLVNPIGATIGSNFNSCCVLYFKVWPRAFGGNKEKLLSACWLRGLHGSPNTW